MIEILNIDCNEKLKTMPDKSVNLFLEDPPYNTTQNKWDVKIDFDQFWRERLRVGKDDCAYVFTAAQPFATDLIISNREMFKYDLIWYKPLGTGHLNANKMPMRNHEHILVFYNKLPTYNPIMGIGIRKAGMRNNKRNGGCYGNFAKANAEVERFDDHGKRFPQSVIEITNGARTKESDHPTQKPIDLMRYLIRTYSNIGDMVFDGFSGSGTTAVACYLENRECTACENDIEYGYYQNSIKRLELIKNQQTLFS